MTNSKAVSKRCPNCKRVKAAGDFYWSTKQNGLSGWCKACANAGAASSTKRRIRAKQVRALAYLREHPCVDCGETNPIVLEFDHVRGHKKWPMSVLITQPKGTLDDLETELVKCDIRCRNCHIIKTASQLKWYRSEWTLVASEELDAGQ